MIMIVIMIIIISPLPLILMPYKPPLPCRVGVGGCEPWFPASRGTPTAASLISHVTQRCGSVLLLLLFLPSPSLHFQQRDAGREYGGQRYKYDNMDTM